LNANLRKTLNALSSGALSHGDKTLFEPLVSSLLNDVDYMRLADYQS
jgi:starch phosphorylase